MTEIERQRKYRRAHQLLDRAKELLDFVNKELEKKVKKAA